MKSLNKRERKIPLRIPIIMSIIIGFLYLYISCELKETFQDETITYYEDYDLSITKYFESNPERFSILTDIMDTTGLSHLLRTYGDYTFLAPTDSAFEAYFNEKGKSSYKDFQKDELTKLLKYHIFGGPFLSGNFNSGIIERKTEELKKIGVARLVGVDILEEAKIATRRDRPGVYDDYYVKDFTRLTEADIDKIKSWELNALTTVAALGFGDIPPAAFIQYCSLFGRDRQSPSDNLSSSPFGNRQP